MGIDKKIYDVWSDIVLQYARFLTAEAGDHRRHEMWELYYCVAELPMDHKKAPYMPEAFTTEELEMIREAQAFFSSFPKTIAADSANEASIGAYLNRWGLEFVRLASERLS